MNVYVLKDPNNNSFRYVGLTSLSITHRLSKHIKDAKTQRRYNRHLSDKEKWLLSLIDNGQKPIAHLMVGNVSKDVGIFVEMNLIAVCGRLCDNSGTLYNVQLGGHMNGDKATPWNRGLRDCYSDEFMANMKRNQTNRKEIHRFDMDSNYVDSWISVRTMCAELGFDRRTVQRCLNKHPNFISHKGYMFSYNRSDIPIYSNKSIIHAKYYRRYGKTS